MSRSEALLACALAAGLVAVDFVAANNVDLFNYGYRDEDIAGGTSFGQEDWGSVTCDDLDSCVRTNNPASRQRYTVVRLGGPVPQSFLCALTDWIPRKVPAWQVLVQCEHRRSEQLPVVQGRRARNVRPPQAVAGRPQARSGPAGERRREGLSRLALHALRGRNVPVGIIR
jgi:hypothetical protein